MKNEKIVDGYSVSLPNFLTVTAENDTSLRKIYLPVMTARGVEHIYLTEKELSKHVLALGGIGSGKTNLIDLLVSQIVSSLTPDDVVVIFDTKGDFLKKFGKPGDIVFGNLTSLPSGIESAKWNIYRDIMIDDEHINENLLEVCKTLFLERSLHNNNPFFPNAARDLLYGVMLANIRSKDRTVMNNQALLQYFQALDIEKLRELLSKHKDLKSCQYYIEGKNVQTQGVVSEVVQLVREVFIDNFALVGNTSIRECVRNKGKKIFIEYDLGIGNTLTPIYRLLLDMVLKESLCRDSQRGNVYIVIDEFSLLPNLQHIADGVNFGRELGVKIIAGLQNIEQMYEAYGEYAAGSILSGFNTRFFFKVNDSRSRKYIQELLGNNRQIYSFQSSEKQKGFKEQIYTGYVVEDWVYEKLPVGAALLYQSGKAPRIIGLPEFTGLGNQPRNTFAIQNTTSDTDYNKTKGFKRIN